MRKLRGVHFSFLLFNLTLICNALNIETASESCTSLKDNLAKGLSAFTLCSINYSRPVTLCENCLISYIELWDSYKNLSEVTVNGTKCLYNFINLDRLQILETQYSNAISLWNQAKCYECYVVENGRPTRKQSNVTTQFRNYYNTFNTCKNSTDNETLCSNCMDTYVILDDYYKSISNANEKIGVCIDLEDVMNATWTYWSTNCCKYRRHNEYIFIVSTTSVLIITVLLYVTVQFCGEKKAPTIIQQSRFAESINRS